MCCPRSRHRDAADTGSCATLSSPSSRENAGPARLIRRRAPATPPRTRRTNWESASRPPPRRTVTWSGRPAAATSAPPAYMSAPNATPAVNRIHAIRRRMRRHRPTAAADPHPENGPSFRGQSTRGVPISGRPSATSARPWRSPGLRRSCPRGRSSAARRRASPKELGATVRTSGPFRDPPLSTQVETTATHGVRDCQHQCQRKVVNEDSLSEAEDRRDGLSACLVS